MRNYKHHLLDEDKMLVFLINLSIDFFIIKNNIDFINIYMKNEAYTEKFKVLLKIVSNNKYIKVSVKMK